jgi:hypothetical protein
MVQKKDQLHVFNVAGLFLCGLFIVLCTAHFLRGRPLWLDEIHVFRSVDMNSLKDFFTRPLHGDQIFPRVYLFLIQKVSKMYGVSVGGARFLPFISMLVAFAAWTRVGRLALKDNLQYLVFLGCWTASIPLIYYSAELKQYSMDVLASGLFTWFLYRQATLAKELTYWKYTALLMFLPLLGFFSYPAFLLMIFPLYNIWMTKHKSRQQWQQIGIYITVCLLVVTAVYLIDIRISRATVETQGFSDYAVSFQSIPEFFRSVGEGTMNLFSRWFTEKPRYMKKVVIPFMVLGMICIPYAFVREWKKDRRQLSIVELLALPIYAELFVLGALQKYPFTVPRTSLFYCPIVFLMTIKAMDVIQTYNTHVYRVVMGAFIVFLTVVTAGIIHIVMTQNLGSICSIW